MIFRFTPLLFFAVALCAQETAVTVREDKLTLPTYDDGAPNPDPQFGAFFRNDFPNYPYTIRTPTNKVRHLTAWRVLILENEYLSCRVLPDLGGHLHGCTDRITGKEVFYSNPAIRRTGESVRGSFIATGIESSFPVAHSRMAGSPVDFAWSVRNGVGDVVVEDTDRTSGMQWRVEFILRPGFAVLEQHVTLYNGSAARRGYHWWTNAAVELDDPHLRVVYPVRWMLPHGNGPMTSWPISDTGVDLSDVANHKGQIGLFAHASREPWMAIYKPKFRSGVAHYADPDQIKGKKIWLWGTDDTYVQSVLTEKFNSYVEMQAGEFETQPEFAFLYPEETRAFTHYWIPFHDLGGVSRVTRDAVLNLNRGGQTVVVELNATHPMRGAKIRLSNGAVLLSETRVDLDPKVKYAKTLESAPAKLTVDVVDAGGSVVLHHVEGEYDSLPFDKTAKNPEPVAPSDTSDSEAASLERGIYNEQRDRWTDAWNDYQSGLKRSPGSAKLKLAAGRAAFVLNRYDDAIRLLGGMEDAEASYYFGAALALRSQRIPDAQSALHRAAQDSRWAMAARLQLVLLSARESGKTPTIEAARALQGLAATPGASVQIGALEVAALRRSGNLEEARRRLEFWLERDPANDMLRVERALLRITLPGSTSDASLWNHLGADPERLLNVAEQYRELGAWDDALTILDWHYAAVPATETEPGMVSPQVNPLVVYYRAWCRMKLGQDPKSDFKIASALPTNYVFPNREIYFSIFEAALRQNDNDAVAHALLGDLDFNSMRTDEAIAQWEKALALKPGLPALHRNLGRALLEIRNDPVAAAPVLLEGLRLDPEDREIAEALKHVTVPTTSGGAAVTPATDLAGSALVKSAIDAEAAAAVFTAASFPKDKQPDAVRRAYIEVQLQRLLAQAHAGKCGDAVPGLEKLGDEDPDVPFTFSGFGSFMKAAHFQYYMGVVESICGEEKAARKRWSKLSRNNDPIDSPDYVFPYLAAKRLGETDAAARINAALQALERAEADHPRPAQLFAQGALLMAAGKSAEGVALLQKSLHDGDSLVQYMSLTVRAEIARK